jgi:hypothetical protein
MKRRALAPFAAIMVVCIGNIIAVLCLLPGIRSHSKHRHALLWLATLSLFYGVSVAVCLFWINRVVIRYSPRCSTCDKTLTGREKSFVVTNLRDFYCFDFTSSLKQSSTCKCHPRQSYSCRSRFCVPVSIRLQHPDSQRVFLHHFCIWSILSSCNQRQIRHRGRRTNWFRTIGSGSPGDVPFPYTEESKLLLLNARVVSGW